MQNTPTVKMGLVAVSRDCFPIELSRARLARVVKVCAARKIDVVPCSVVIESENDAIKAAAELHAVGVNAVTIYLGNFGPEGPLTIFARELGVPFMLCAAAEESARTLVDGRGDAYCGMLNASINCGLRKLTPYMAPAPVGLAEDVAEMIAHFTRVARVVIGVRALKTFSFGPRPQDFYACNAPIKPLYDLGIEVMENSELDMLMLYQDAAAKTKEIAAVAKDMARELGRGNKHPEKLHQLAQFEVALVDFFERNLGSRQFGLFANKCWPSFERAFGFVPCFVNSRLAARGIPAACEVDIYGGLSEYMAQCATLLPATILDVNNTVPPDLKIRDLAGAARADLFMGFHCGNTPSCCLCDGCSMKHQLIMHRLMEPGREPDITCGTLEGTLRPGPVTVFRLQGTADCRLQSYVAQGHVLDADPHSFGGIGIFGIPDFARFYRYVLLAKQYPHHAAVAFDHAGRVLFDAARMMGVTDVAAPRAAGNLYPDENPFAS
jgi:L-fucose isomerase-like protein